MALNPKTKHKPVWVVMGNDYPDAVFTSETEAEAYCFQKRTLNQKHREQGGRLIYWRTYRFALDKEVGHSE